jgi:hypothetical protein
MNRSSGWVELIAPGNGRRRRRARTLMLADVRALVPPAPSHRTMSSAPTVVLRDVEGRWHLWLESGAAPDARGLLPLFKAVGALAPSSFGVLDLVGPDGHIHRWVMTHGSVQLAAQPDPYRPDLHRVDG